MEICDVPDCGRRALTVSTCEAADGRAVAEARFCVRHTLIAKGLHAGPVSDEEFDLVKAVMFGQVFEEPLSIIPIGAGYEIWDIRCQTVGEYPTLAAARRALAQLAGA